MNQIRLPFAWNESDLEGAPRLEYVGDLELRRQFARAMVGPGQSIEQLDKFGDHNIKMISSILHNLVMAEMTVAKVVGREGLFEFPIPALFGDEEILIVVRPRSAVH